MLIFRKEQFFMKNAKILLVVILLILTTIQVHAKENADWTIYPGIGVGWIRVGGCNYTYLESALGEADDKSFCDDGDVMMSYKRYGLTFFFNGETNMLNKILVENSIYKTTSGVCVGMSIVDVVKKYYPGGEYNNDKKMYFTNNGICFFYDSSGKVKSIFIFNLNID